MECPMCGGDGTELGSLGWRQHFRCRDCGMDYSVDTRPKAKVPEKNEDDSRRADERQADHPR